MVLYGKIIYSIVAGIALIGLLFYFIQVINVWNTSAWSVLEGKVTETVVVK